MRRKPLDLVHIIYQWNLDVESFWMINELINWIDEFDVNTNHNANKLTNPFIYIFPYFPFAFCLRIYRLIRKQHYDFVEKHCCHVHFSIIIINSVFRSENNNEICPLPRLRAEEVLGTNRKGDRLKPQFV